VTAPGESVQAFDADAILRTLVDHKVDFVVIGGLAVAAHGYVRATKEVDVMPNPDPGNLSRLYRALASLDARPIEIGDFGADELPVPFGLGELEGGGNWALRTNCGRLDVMQSLSGIESYDVLRAGALAVELPDVGPILFAGYDDLVSMKRAAGRPDDRRDLERLREARAGSAQSSRIARSRGRPSGLAWRPCREIMRRWSSASASSHSASAT
jgi:hypothetical protein